MKVSVKKFNEIQNHINNNECEKIDINCDVDFRSNQLDCFCGKEMIVINDKQENTSVIIEIIDTY